MTGRQPSHEHALTRRTLDETTICGVTVRHCIELQCSDRELQGLGRLREVRMKRTRHGDTPLSTRHGECHPSHWINSNYFACVCCASWRWPAEHGVCNGVFHALPAMEAHALNPLRCRGPVASQFTRQGPQYMERVNTVKTSALHGLWFAGRCKEGRHMVGIQALQADDCLRHRIALLTEVSRKCGTGRD